MLSAPINTSSSGNTTIVAGVSGRSIRVLGIAVLISGSNTVQVQDTNSTLIIGPFTTTGPSGYSLPILPQMGYSTRNGGWATLAAGAGLVLNLTASVQVGGVVVYDLVQ